jgi:hypothetical protein
VFLGGSDGPLAITVKNTPGLIVAALPNSKRPYRTHCPYRRREPARAT